jgi:hypothetical protein
MSESDVDAMVERMAREERDDLGRAHGEAILDAVAASEARRRGSADDPLVQVLRQAHQAKVEGDKE